MLPSVCYLKLALPSTVVGWRNLGYCMDGVRRGESRLPRMGSMAWHSLAFIVYIDGRIIKEGSLQYAAHVRTPLIRRHGLFRFRRRSFDMTIAKEVECTVVWICDMHCVDLSYICMQVMIYSRACQLCLDLEEHPTRVITWTVLRFHVTANHIQRYYSDAIISCTMPNRSNR